MIKRNETHKVILIKDYEDFEYATYLVENKDYSFIESEIKRLTINYYDNYEEEDFGLKYGGLFCYLEEKLLKNYNAVDLNIISID